MNLNTSPCLVPRSEIWSILPHRHPMLMVDQLNSCDARCTRTCFEIRADNIFIRSGKFQEPGLVENMAQTAAAGAGWLFLQKQMERPTNFLAAVSKLSIEQLPDTGDMLITETEMRLMAAGMAMLSAHIELNGVRIASCELKVSGNFVP